MVFISYFSNISDCLDQVYTIIFAYKNYSRFNNTKLRFLISGLFWHNLYEHTVKVGYNEVQGEWEFISL